MPTSEERSPEPWRETAWRHMPCRPCFRDLFAAATSHEDLWRGFKEFVAEAGARESSREEVQAIFTYAWWCVAWSEDAELASVSKACFYEDLPTRPDLAALVPRFVAAWQFERLEGAFRSRLTDEAYDAFRSGYYGLSDEPGPPRLWRELALAHMPAFRDTIGAADSDIDLWWTLKAFVAEEGPKESSRAEVESIFAYAWWCVKWSKDEWLASAAEIYFYEDLSAHSNLEGLVPVFVAPWQFERLEKAFRYLLTDDEFDAFRSNYYVSVGRRSGWFSMKGAIPDGDSIHPGTESEEG